MKLKKITLATATLGSALMTLPAFAGCAGLVVGTYTQKSWNYYATYLCISNANYDAQSNNGFSNGAACPANSFPVLISSGSTSSSYPSHCCFAYGTPIWLPDGSKVSIETIIAGDLVCVYNLKTGEVESAQVLNSIKKSRQLYRLVFDNGSESLLLTDDHPLWNGHTWCAINPKNAASSYDSYQLQLTKLHVGSRLLTASGSHRIVTAIEFLHAAPAADVYTLQVNHSDHNYLVSELGLIAHNSCKT
ncbi:hypothetical protein HA052_05030 [Chromobacterium haemolyticum]|uniref:Hint domain-containing protein n=1 Tax=Chromobacterium fluminis TaxID=3044269 RepID=A0ABX0KYI5_9NEIS|nr:hypothetical protein [Chromobacterium haemolyticum]NHR04555.1 hypothetical protein [Chromobacterium haemolyticum]